MAKKKRPVYSDEERIIRVWDIETIKDLMSLRAILDANGEHAEELEKLWVSQPETQATASFGKNWGYYVGMDAIRGYYVDHFATLNVCNTGYFALQPLSTPHVVIADDGKTAQGTWYSIGVDCRGKGPGQAECNWNAEKICADFVKEADGWKIWHLFVSWDYSVEAGHSASEYTTIYIRGTGVDETEFGTPTVPMLAHDPSYTWCDNYPPLNEMTYATFTEEIGYGPEGHPKYEE
jgi:hypothetical protein